VWRRSTKPILRLRRRQQVHTHRDPSTHLLGKGRPRLRGAFRRWCGSGLPLRDHRRLDAATFRRTREREIVLQKLDGVSYLTCSGNLTESPHRSSSGDADLDSLAVAGLEGSYSAVVVLRLQGTSSSAAGSTDKQSHAGAVVFGSRCGLDGPCTDVEHRRTWSRGRWLH